MVAFNFNFILFIVLVFGIGIYLLFKIILKNQETKQKLVQRSSNTSQDFSAFESSPDKFKSSLDETSVKSLDEDEEEESEVVTIKGNIVKLEEFLDKLNLIPKDSLDDIQISLGEKEDLFISIEKDIEKGILATVYYMTDLNISYEIWSSRIKEIIWEYRFESKEEEDDGDKFFTIYNGDKSLLSFAEFIKKIVEVGYSEYKGKNILVEFNHY